MIFLRMYTGRIIRALLLRLFGIIIFFELLFHVAKLPPREACLQGRRGWGLKGGAQLDDFPSWDYIEIQSRNTSCSFEIQPKRYDKEALRQPRFGSINMLGHKKLFYFLLLWPCIPF